jgi:hypothetical protein
MICFFVLSTISCFGQANYITDAFPIVQKRFFVQSECDLLLLSKDICMRSNEFKSTTFFNFFLTDMLKDQKRGLGYPDGKNPFYDLPSEQLKVLRDKTNWNPLGCSCYEEIVTASSDCELSEDRINEAIKKYSLQREAYGILFNGRYAIYFRILGNDWFSATALHKIDGDWFYQYGKSNIPFSDE